MRKDEEMKKTRGQGDKGRKVITNYPIPSPQSPTPNMGEIAT
ncbi:hypothetical protein FDUTEX481_06224 [Tolypothrix sp. PCC 7601]|nr:hypothetical protein FDUTEX481_06224 [Tolypothrix sp. PCC 7601]